AATSTLSLHDALPIFKSIRNATIASVFGGVLLMLIPVVRQYVVTAAEALWSALLWCWSALIGSYSAPGWLWLVVVGFALVGAIRSEEHTSELQSREKL